MKLIFFLLPILLFSVGCNPLVQNSSADPNYNPGFDSACSNTQVDQNNSTLGFGGGSFTGVAWDATRNYMRLAQTGTPTNNSELDSGWAPAWSSLVAYLKLNDSVGSPVVADSSSGGTNSGGVTGGVTLGIAGKLNTAAALNGALSGCINAGNAPSVQITSGTISAWINTTAPGAGYQTIVAKQNAYGLFLFNSVLVNFDWSTATTNTTNINIADGNWHYVAFSFQSGVVNGTQTFLDGVPVLTNTYTISSQTTFLGVGCNAAGGQNITGTLDDVAVWNTNLSASQIQSIYIRQLPKYSGTYKSRIMSGNTSSDTWKSLAWTPTLPFFKELPDGGVSESPSNYSSQTSSLLSGLVGIWHMDESGGVTAIDKSGNGMSGTYNGGYTLDQPGKLGNATLLNGTSGYVLTGNLKGLFTNTDLTLSIWFKAIGAGVIAAELGQSTINTSWHDSQIEILPGGQVKISVWQGAVYNLPLGTVNFGQWNHVILRYNTGATYLDGFLNGVQIAGIVGAREYPNTSFASNYYYALGPIDSTNLGGGTWFNGYVDEFAVWSRPILNSEAIEIYRRGANRLKYQIQTCSNALTCVTSSNWKGPDNTNQTYFSELNNNSIPSDGADLTVSDSVLAGLPGMLFSNFSSLSGSTNQYFQYQAIFESDDITTNCNYDSGVTWCSPELQNVSITQTCK